MAREAAPARVAIVGAGRVGSSIAYASLIRGVARHLALFDLDKAKVAAEVLDLSHGRQFVPMAEVVGSSDIEVCRDSDVIVITAGANQKPGETRLDLLKTNVALCRDLVPRLTALSPRALLMVVTNPVDVLTHVCREVSGLPKERVLGTGTTLDTSRFRHALAERCSVAVTNVHAFIVGEHGDTELPLWSSATIAGAPVDEWLKAEGRPFRDGERGEIFEKVKNAAYEVIRGKGATNYAIGLTAARLLEAILNDENMIAPVSADVTSAYGLFGVTLSLPRILNRKGAGPIVPLPLSGEEREALKKSAEAIRNAAGSVGF